jgi:collagenase-like PrtC family protease
LTLNHRKPELLAPVGSPAALKAACLAKADSIYLSGKRFGARAFATNFDDKGLRWARRVTLSRSVKMYITLNTILFENEWNLLQETLDFYETLQPDALIIQDPGVARELRKRKSRIPIHLSTQAAWFGIDALPELKELNISRVILPREMSFDNVQRTIEEFSDIEIEVFVHGAMCYSISGRCFWSIALGSRSGNRGTCAQPCRREYFSDKEINQSKNLFSPHDLRLIDKIDQISKLGVSALKIEGRMKSPEYVYQVVKAYRQAIDGQISDTESLNEVFSRSFFEGFFNGIPEPDSWQTRSTPGREGVIIGKAAGESRNGLTGIFSDTDLKAGDGIFWYERDQKKGARLTWIKKDRKQKNLYWVRGPGRNLKKDTEIRRTSSGSQKEYENLWNKDWERRPIDLYWSGHDGSVLAVETRINEYPIRIETDEILTSAINKGLDEGPLQEKFAVLGEFFAAGNHITRLLGKKLHLCSRGLKKLKRALVEVLLKFEQLPPPRENQSGIFAILPPPKRKTKDLEIILEPDNCMEIFVKVWNQNFPFVRDLYPDCWVLPWQADNSRANKILTSRIAHWLPFISEKKQLDELVKELKEVESGEFFCFGWEIFKLSKEFPHLTFYLDWSFNICNFSAIAFLTEKGIKPVFSREWKEEEIPENIKGFRCLPAWNPLISFSKFPQALKPKETVQNSHRDKFFSLYLGNEVYGTFLEDKPAAITHKENSAMLDVAISPKENPVQAAKDLNRLIKSFKSGFTKS